MFIGSFLTPYLKSSLAVNKWWDSAYISEVSEGSGSFQPVSFPVIPSFPLSRQTHHPEALLQLPHAGFGCAVPLLGRLQPHSSSYLERERHRSALPLQHVCFIRASHAGGDTAGPHGRAAEGDVLRCQCTGKRLACAPAGRRRFGFAAASFPRHLTNVP